MSIQKIYNVAEFIDDKMLEKIKLKSMKEELKSGLLLTQRNVTPSEYWIR